MILLIAGVLWLLAIFVAAFGLRTRPRARRDALLDIAAFGLIGAATVGFFWRLLVTQDVWMPAGGGDLAGFIYPTYQFAAEWWRRGVIPLWNPSLFGGQPFVGDIQSGIFYPLNLLTFFVSYPLTYRDLELLSVLHYYIAGAGMYALLRWGILRKEQGEARGEERLLRGDIAAALVGAIAFEFSDLFITHFGNLNLIASAAWLPLVFLFYWRAVTALSDTSLEAYTASSHSSLANRLQRISRPGPLAPAVISGVFLSLSLLAGHVQSFVFVTLSITLYAFYHALTRRGDAIRTILLLILTLAVGLALGALVFIPAIEMTRLSVRSAFSYENASQYSLPPTELVGLLIPGFFGRGPQAAWGPWDRVEVGYIGVLPLILAALALVLRRDRKTWFFAMTALAGLVLALGGYTIFHGWLYASAPGLGQLRAPARFIYLLDFGLAVLAALGMHELLQPLTTERRRALWRILRVTLWLALLVGIGAAGTALAMLALGQGQDPALYQRVAKSANAIWFFLLLLALSLVLLVARVKSLVSAPLWQVLALMLIAFDLFSLGAYVDIGLSDPTASYKRDDIADFLSRDMSYYRIDSRGTGIEGAWLPDTAILYRLFDVNGDNPLVLADFERYWQAQGGRDSPMYQRLNVKYVLARQSTPLPANFKRVFDGASGISVWENRDALPRARVVFESNVLSDRNRILESLQDPRVDPTRIVYLEQGASRTAEQSSGSQQEDVEITGYGANEIDVSVGEGKERYLVLSEVYYPGWRAFVDGHETLVLRADYIYRAVSLTPGAHQIRMIYDPFSFKLGAFISAGMLALLIGFGLVKYAVFKRTH